MGSTIPRAMAWLVDSIDALAWPAEDSQGLRPLVAYGPPRSLEREHVIVGDNGDEDAQQEWIGLGASRREERYVIPVTVYVHRPGDDGRQAHERAMALWDAIADLLLANTHLGFTGAAALPSLSAEVSQPRARLGPEPEGYGCTIEAGVRVVARI